MRKFILFFALLAFAQPAFALTRIVELLAAGVTDNAGKALSGGTVTFYDAGTTNLRTVYTNFSLSTPAANPVTLDSAGRYVVYTDKRIKLLVKNAAGVTVRTIDNVGTSGADIAVDVSDTTLAGDGLTAPGDGSLAVNVDNSTLEIVADTVQLKSTITGNRTVTGTITSTGNLIAGSSNAGTLIVGGPSGPVLSSAVYTGLTPVLRLDRTFQFGSGGPILQKGGSGGSGDTLNIVGASSGLPAPIVTSASASDAHGLLIVRGTVEGGASPTIVSGEGFTVARVSTGLHDITFSTAFASAPSVVTAAGCLGILSGYITTISTTLVRIFTYNPGVGVSDCQFSFVAIGQRGI